METTISTEIHVCSDVLSGWPPHHEGKNSWQCHGASIFLSQQQML